MTIEDAPAVSVRRWYQRTWLWIVVGFVLTPLALLLVLLVTSILQLPVFVSALAFVVFTAVALISVWMGGLVARRAWARGFLLGFTILFLLLETWVLWEYDGGWNVWVVFSVLWVAPLLVLFLLRSRFRPDDLMPLGSRSKRTLAFVVAPLLAVLGMWAGWNYIQHLEAEREAGEELVTVYRASDLIEEGTQGLSVVSNEGAYADTVKVKSLPEAAITNLDQLEAILSGRVATKTIQPNSILTIDQWVEEP